MGAFLISTNMYNLSNIIVDIKEVPEEWIYINYLRKVDRPFSQPMDGRHILLRSPWSNDSNASFYLFAINKRYYWRDFSTNTGGDAFKLARRIISPGMQDASFTIKVIIKDYTEFLESGGKIEKIEIIQKKLTYKEHICDWDEYNYRYYQEYKITLATLDFYNIKPLISYKVFDNGKVIVDTYRRPMYGFYCSTGLYKIYMPGAKNKYICTNSKYICGLEQLKYNKKILIIQSGLKDMCALKELGLSVENIASNSETTMLNADLISYLKQHYIFIFTLFDNDRAGKVMSLLYKEKYNIPAIFPKFEKDVADDLKATDKLKLKNIYAELINKGV